MSHGLDRGRILEIGCGRGIVVNYLRHKGLDCHGVELSRIEIHDESLDGYVHAGMDVFTLPKEFRESIETIMLLDVIEHLPDPLNFLIRIRQHFPNVQAWILTAPARQELWSNYDEFYGHYARYDIKAIHDLLERFGVRSLDVRYFFHCLYLPAKIMIAFKGIRDIRIKAPSPWLGWIQSALTGLCVLDYLCVPSSVPGTSIISVCRTISR